MTSARAAGLLIPFHIEPGLSVLELGGGDGSLTSALAGRGVRLETLEADPTAARLAGRRSVGHEHARVEQASLAQWWDRAATGDTTYDVVLHRQPRDGSGGLALDLESIVGIAAAVLRPSGSLVLALENPWGLRRLLTGGERGAGSSRARVAALLALHGFRHVRWLLPFPDHHEPEVIVQAALLEDARGRELVTMLVRRPVAGPQRGERLIADPMPAFRAAVEAGLAVDLADALIVVASRGGSGALEVRNGQLWILPPGHLGAAWQRPREILGINARWLAHATDGYAARDAGPLHLESPTYEVPGGASGEDVLAEALMRHGPFDPRAADVLATWWHALVGAIERAEPRRWPLDVAPRDFAVDAGGSWTHLPGDLTLRFRLPPEVLALRSLMPTLDEAVLSRGWLPGLDPSMSVREAAVALLATAGVRCGEEHVMLWRELETDLRARTGDPGVERDVHRQAVTRLERRSIGEAFEGLPVSVVLEAGRDAPRLAAALRALEVAADRDAGEMEDVETTRLAAADELERARADGVSLAAELTAMRGALEAAGQREGALLHGALDALAASEELFEAARTGDWPWSAAAESVCRDAGLAIDGPVRRSTAGRNPTLLVPPDHVVKLYGPWHAGHELAGHELYLRERATLRILERDPGLPVPRIVGQGALAEAWRHLVLTLLPGTPLGEADAEGRADLRPLAGWLGHLVRQVHAVPLEDEERAAGWSRFLAKVERRHRTATSRLRSEGSMPAPLVGQIEGWLPDVAELVGRSDEAVLSHGDLTPAHVLGRVTEGGFEPSGVIDWANAHVGHPLFELGPVWGHTLRADRRLLEAFLAAARLPGADAPDFPRRALAWAILNPRWPWPDLPWAAEVASLDELAERIFGPVLGHG